MARLKTKDRILQCALSLFNAQGEPSVTTLNISNELEISPGNLYYHYKGKDAIVGALFQQFEQELKELQSIDDTAGLLDVLLYLQLNFEVMARSLFLFRDLNDVLQRYGLQKRFQAILGSQRRALHALCERLEVEGVLQADKASIEHLVEHMLMNMCFGIAFQQVQGVSGNSGFEPDLAQCAYNTVQLLQPYLDAEEAAALNEMSSLYL